MKALFSGRQLQPYSAAAADTSLFQKATVTAVFSTFI
jgi:hypothetical protein